ncbi:hypothetical protein [Thermoflexus hugenholtzii]|uniref:Uncharacterized protein n=1 Tax=Thermoflexus hugenholtzii JAD2 TaxID=877466 RepID=A0A212QNQ5_9CHLR|nr:hypothetical protein [Thermoflexus hugenholtzii]SNB61014.1 hypothetical protein SAMN02746019_00026540 [Thermoflexus hugenholtzii JAD2]
MWLAGLLLPYLPAGALALLWGLVELAQTFESDLGRALRSPWALVFLAGNVLLTGMVLAMLELAFPLEPRQRLLLALLAGFGWQALLRTRIHLFQPLGEQHEAVALSILDLYRRFQRFCWRQIDQTLIAERMALLDRASNLPLDYLRYQFRLQRHASLLSDFEQREAEFWKRLSQLPEDEQRLYLAASLLRIGYGFLNEVVKRAPAQATSAQRSSMRE